MLKKQLYPKTSRMKGGQGRFIVTEKIDGSNLGIFKLNDELHVAQRNYVYKWSERENADGMYKGLFGWLTENADTLAQSIGNGQIIFGEFLGMRPIDYGDDYMKFTMFAKATIGDNLELKNLHYDPVNFKYGFSDSKDENGEYHIPACVGIVKVVKEFDFEPDQIILDDLYEEYCNSVGRKVEGFITIKNGNSITKYVRLKDGKMKEHVSNRYKNRFEHMQEEMFKIFGVSRETLLSDPNDINELSLMLSIDPSLLKIDKLNGMIEPETVDAMIRALEETEEQYKEHMEEITDEEL